MNMPCDFEIPSFNGSGKKDNDFSQIFEFKNPRKKYERAVFGKPSH